jgi:hypothetical protein
MKKTLVGICLLVVLIPFSSLTADDESTRGAESSPFTVGAWKLVCNDVACQNPILDTEFRFINPTPLTLTLEYAFFENDGTFCGCDRDTLAPNKTTVYTASGERNSSPSLMQCKGNSGALKSIVFANHEGNKISINGATQTGFQTHLFRNITTAADGMTSYADTMGEAGMKGIAITSDTLAEVRAIHQACVNFPPVGPLK